MVEPTQKHDFIVTLTKSKVMNKKMLLLWERQSPEIWTCEWCAKIPLLVLWETISWWQAHWYSYNMARIFRVKTDIWAVG